MRAPAVLSVPSRASLFAIPPANMAKKVELDGDAPELARGPILFRRFFQQCDLGALRQVNFHVLDDFFGVRKHGIIREDCWKSVMC